MAKKYQELNPHAAGLALALLGVIFTIIAMFWHGGMGQPSMMGYMYPGFSYMNPFSLFTLLVVFVAGGYVIGWVATSLYNRFLEYV